jgi:hypothetical protein
MPPPPPPIWIVLMLKHELKIKDRSGTLLKLVCHALEWCTVSDYFVVQSIWDGKSYDKCVAVGGMRTGREAPWRKPAPVPLCPPQIPHDLTWARTQASMMGRRQLIAWAMAWPSPMVSTDSEISLHCWYITQDNMSELVNDTDYNEF